MYLAPSPPMLSLPIGSRRRESLAVRVTRNEPRRHPAPETTPRPQSGGGASNGLASIVSGTGSPRSARRRMESSIRPTCVFASIGSWERRTTMPSLRARPTLRAWFDASRGKPTDSCKESTYSVRARRHIVVPIGRRITSGEANDSASTSHTPCASQNTRIPSQKASAASRGKAGSDGISSDRAKRRPLMNPTHIAELPPRTPSTQGRAPSARCASAYSALRNGFAGDPSATTPISFLSTSARPSNTHGTASPTCTARARADSSR